MTMQKIIKYLGIFTILAFSAISMFMSFSQRDSNNKYSKYFKYTVYFEERFFDFRLVQNLKNGAEMETVDKHYEVLTDKEQERIIALPDKEREAVMRERSFRLKNKKNFDSEIVLAEIDDYSIKGFGSWPIPRQNWGKLIDKLRVFGAKIVAFDVFFGEESLTCGQENPDQYLSDSIKRFHKVPGNRVVLPYNLFVNGTKSYPEPPEALNYFALVAKQTRGSAMSIDEISDSVYPIDVLLEHDPALGFIEAKPDSDGIIRHYKAFSNIYGDLFVPSFSLVTYQNYTGEIEAVISDDDDEDETLSDEELLNDTLEEQLEEDSFSTIIDLTNPSFARINTQSGNIYTNLLGESKLRWFGGMTSFPRISIYDIVMADDDDEWMNENLKDTVVFVGATAFGAHDIRHTPVDPQLPGVYFHMNFFKNLKDGTFLQAPTKSIKISWLILILSSVILLLIQLKGNPILDLFSVITILGGVYFVDTYYLISQGYEIKLFFCFFSIIGCYSWNTFLHFYLANKDKAFLKSAFGSYISPELIDEMYSNGEPPKLGGDSGIRTAYFTDIQSFSTFSEKLSATQLVELLNEYLTAMTDILLEEKGTLDKYEGDAIIAFFGAPMPLEDHAKRACLVAHKMQEKLLELREKWTSEGDKWPLIVHEMRMRIGINSGEIVTGNMGSASRMNYTMMGDSVNLAARLEESAKQYGIFTQVAKETVELAGDEFLWRELDTIRVVGKSVPVTSYDLLGIKETAPDYLKELAKKFEEGLSLYRSQKWDEAIAIFEQTEQLEWQRYPGLKGKKTNPSEIYLERCKSYKENPPADDWDGVYTLTSK